MQEAQIITTIENMVKKLPNQEEVINYLYTLGFKGYYGITPIITSKYPSDCTINIRDKHTDFPLLVRLSRKKKWDLRIMFLIRLRGRKETKIHIYKDGEYYKTLRKPWKQSHNFKTIKLGLKFTDEFEDYDERHRWRDEHIKLMKNPNRTPSEFYEKWKHTAIIIRPDKYGDEVITR